MSPPIKIVFLIKFRLKKNIGSTNFVQLNIVQIKCKYRIILGWNNLYLNNVESKKFGSKKY